MIISTVIVRPVTVLTLYDYDYSGHAPILSKIMSNSPKRDKLSAIVIARLLWNGLGYWRAHCLETQNMRWPVHVDKFDLLL